MQQVAWLTAGLRLQAGANDPDGRLQAAVTWPAERQCQMPDLRAAILSRPHRRQTRRIHAEQGNVCVAITSYHGRRLSRAVRGLDSQLLVPLYSVRRTDDHAIRRPNQ